MPPTAKDVLRRKISDLLARDDRQQIELARYLGYQPSWVTDVLKGRHGVSLDDLDRIARFFGVSVPQLFELDGSRFRDLRRGERRSGQDRRKGDDRRKTP